jgi:acetyl esterase/lipase
MGTVVALYATRVTVIENVRCGGEDGGVDESVLVRGSAAPDAVVAWGPGADDVADVRLGADDRPLLVVVHGGFWRPAYDRSHLGPMTEALNAAGWTVAAPEYRRVPGDPDGTAEDVRVALRVLPVELRGRHDGRVVVLGHSAGGHLALWAASAAPAAGLVATIGLAPVADLAAADRERLGTGAVEAFLGGPGAGRPDLDPARTVSAAQPVTLVHGGQDAVVPVSQSRSYAAAHPGTELLEVPDAGHYALIDPLSSAWPVVLDAVRAAVGRAG